MTRKSGAAAGLAALGMLLAALATPILAHHSTTMFVDDKTITLEGTMTEVAFGNPHSLFFLDAKPVEKPGDPVKNWSVEAPNPRRLIGMGWQRDTIKTGDKVRITGFARRDGKPQILFIEISDDKGHHFAEKRENYAGD
jgi:hypothetical protein